MSSPAYTCQHCSKGFKLERAFMKHTCRQLERTTEIQTIDGISAYQLYKYWLQKQKRKAPPPLIFTTSMFYGAFIKFVHFIKKMSIASSEKYIDLIIESKISPQIWTNVDAYNLYLEWNDRKSQPLEQVEISLSTIISLAEDRNVKICNLFEDLKFGEVFQLIQVRKLSPWLLLCSGKFKSWLQQQSNDEHKQLIRLIGLDYWATKFESNQETISEIKKVVEAFNL